MTDNPAGIRLDKWLWAARFYKTRSLAKQAVEGGKVHYNGERCKVSKEVQVGATLTIRSGWDSKVVDVIALSGQRRGAPEAALLYRETEDSIRAREQIAADRKILGAAAGLLHPERPNKKQRRQIHRFKNLNDE
ncbi:MAG: S4 domain-containing protein [Zhongshania sp.]|uniref:RNA-binding S4 domain-containing protein n=1 Tax=Zhongshania sp. TaxID=1971902 RepID=UPI002613A9B2|nr:S4 domain-containing protein [Zhongshania sp.]MDF1692577.1 S4 domain-containing protein [Zhongshania sp.]